MGRHSEGIPISELLRKVSDGTLDAMMYVHQEPVIDGQSLGVIPGALVPRDAQLAMRTCPYRVPPEVEELATQLVERQQVDQDPRRWARVVAWARVLMRAGESPAGYAWLFQTESIRGFGHSAVTPVAAAAPSLTRSEIPRKNAPDSLGEAGAFC
jgi:hypothetical protein